MNRQQRRAQQKNSGSVGAKQKTYNLSLDQIQQIKQNASAQAMEQAFILMMGLPLMALRDKFDFGKVRLERFSDAVLDLWDSFNNDYITLQDCIDAVYEETGVKIEGKEMREKKLF